MAPADNTAGGVPGGNIRNAFLYNPQRVDLVDYTSLTPAVLGALGVGNPDAFEGTRDPLLATFKFRGKELTIVNNHLTSRFGSTPVFGGPQPFVQAGETEREAQMAALNEVVDALLSDANGNPVHASKSGRIIVLGDLNTMEFTDDLTDILPGPDQILSNLIDSASDDNVYTFNFEGNSQVLDHMLVTDNLAGTAAFDIVHVNVDFPRVDASVGSDHEPLVGRFGLNGTTGANFTLTVLHNNDGESELVDLGSGLEDFGGVARFATVVQREKREALAGGGGSDKSGVVMVSSGDNFLAGPEFAASTNDGLFYDAIALDLIGYDAIDIGNHDFDFGPDVLEQFINTYRLGADEVYLSANLDFSGEPGLQALVDRGKIAKSTIVRERGERIGIVGATTANLPFISSPRNVVVDPDIVAAVQGEIDLLEAAGINKIIFISHLQDVEGDIALLAELDGVDVAVAGGGDELLANPGDPLVPGDEGEVFGPYPLIATDSSGSAVPVVTTSGQYGYLGKLVVEFDADGNLLRVDDASGPIRIAGGAQPDAVAADRRVERLVTDPVSEFVSTLATQIVGDSEVDLDGTRGNIRSVATNEGNLIADALLWQAQQLAGEFGVPEADISIQNGGGIRNDSVIPAGPISELDTFSMVPFPNFLTVTTLSRDRVKEILEHAVSCAVAGDPAYGGASSCGSGRFAQVGGLSFVWDSAGTQQQLDADGNVSQAGTRIVSATLADGTPLVAAGVVVPGADLTIATIDFLARGGDQYPYRDAPFDVLGASYQQALSSYIQTALGGAITAADYPEGGGGRIERL